MAINFPARLPTPEYTVKNVQMVKEKFDIDFILIVDENKITYTKLANKFLNSIIKYLNHKIFKS